jgi:heptosyltransferase-2
MLAPLPPAYRYVRPQAIVLMAVIDCLGWWFSWPLRWFPVQKASGVSRILIIQLDHFGDAILSWPMIAALKQSHPTAQIDILAGTTNAELWRLRSEVGRVYVMSCNRFERMPKRRRGWPFAIFRWGWRLHREQYDLAIDPRGELPHALLMWLAGIPMRAGWAAGGGGWLLTHSAEYQKHRHETESRHALLNAIGIRSHSNTPRYEPDTSSREQIHARWPRDARPRIALHLGSGMPAKRWPIERWTALAQNLATQCELVIVGGRDDEPFAQKVLNDLPDNCSVVNTIGQVSIEELAVLFTTCDAYVGSDSGPGHLAGAVGTPVVVLFSGTNDMKQWQPVGSAVTVLRMPAFCSPCHRTECNVAGHPCMQTISLEMVMRALQNVVPSLKSAEINSVNIAIDAESASPTQVVLPTNRQGVSPWAALTLLAWTGLVGMAYGWRLLDQMLAP